MARTFGNTNNDLPATLRATMQVSRRSNFCVGFISNYDIQYRMGSGIEANDD